METCRNGGQAQGRDCLTDGKIRCMMSGLRRRCAALSGTGWMRLTDLHQHRSAGLFVRQAVASTRLARRHVTSRQPSPGKGGQASWRTP